MSSSLTCACRKWMEWPPRARSDRISVNSSDHQFAQPPVFDQPTQGRKSRPGHFAVVGRGQRLEGVPATFQIQHRRPVDEDHVRSGRSLERPAIRVATPRPCQRRAVWVRGIGRGQGGLEDGERVLAQKTGGAGMGMGLFFHLSRGCARMASAAAAGSSAAGAALFSPNVSAANCPRSASAICSTPGGARGLSAPRKATSGILATLHLHFQMQDGRSRGVASGVE